MIFIVGNSRSGTTMMGRILGLHSDIYTFDELHFIEGEISGADLTSQVEWPTERLMTLLERLFTSARHGLFAPVRHGQYLAEADRILALASGTDPVSVYECFLTQETQRAGKTIPCEQTPRYLFFAEEMLAAFPEARIVNMIRDPRDVLLSQKNRWRREYFNENRIPALWTLRAWSNYHPYLTSRFWVSAVHRSEQMTTHPRFFSIRYETLVNEPCKTLNDLCDDLGIEFQPEMMAVSQIGSSTGEDRPDKLGIDTSRIGAWQRGGLSDAEIAICEKAAGVTMREQGYEQSGTKASVFRRASLNALLPVKLGLAAMLNFGRFRDLPEAIRRRLS